MDDRPSERIIEQRLRNRAIEALGVLAEGDVGVRAVGNVDYINGFFDLIDDDVSSEWRNWSTLTSAEVSALDKVQRLLLEACVGTPQVCSDDEFIASRWPARIRPVAAEALALMRPRGSFHEDREEESPSN